MAWTQQQLDDLKAAIAASKGARTIAFGDQSITLHSVDDLLKLLDRMQGEVTAAAAAASGGSTTRFAATSKGT